MAETAMTVRDVAAYLNVNEKTVYRLDQKREIPVATEVLATDGKEGA
ncbi:MAG: helix-turn-helix domain-containing protein [Bradymonadales bacterium]|nr:helix-turn-helix domain-containing protein [Bradymonadales bacterium]